MSKVHVFDHPLIQHKLSYIRDVNTGTKEFRELVDEVGMLTTLYFQTVLNQTLDIYSLSGYTIAVEYSFF